MRRKEEQNRLEYFTRKEYYEGKQTLKALVLTLILSAVVWSVAIGWLLKSCFS
jgi:hypothetical protein